MLTRFTAALASALTAVVLVAAPAMAWAPREGPLFNNPKGTLAAKYRLQLRVETAIRNAVPGSEIRIATYLLDRRASSDALINARRRGVSVQVVMDGRIDTPMSRDLQRVLNADNGNAGLQWGPDRELRGAVCRQLPRRRAQPGHARQVLRVLARPEPRATS